MACAYCLTVEYELASKRHLGHAVLGGKGTIIGKRLPSTLCECYPNLDGIGKVWTLIYYAQAPHVGQALDSSVEELHYSRIDPGINFLRFRARIWGVISGALLFLFGRCHQTGDKGQITLDSFR